VTRISMLISVIFISGFYLTCFAQLNNSEIKYLSESADIIVAGKVIQQSSNWNENQTRIYTRATIQVEEYLKGNNNGNSVIVTYPGGEVGEVGEMYSHTPRFENNEDVLVFLKNDEKSTGYKVLNGEQGKISIIIDSKTGEQISNSNIKINSLKEQIKNYIND